MQDLLKTLYGDDVVNTALKILFEFLFYTTSASIGAVIRELQIEKKRSLARGIASSLIVAVILFVGANYLKAKIKDVRLLFGIAVLLGIYLPNFKSSLRNGSLFRAIVGIFSEKAQKFLEDTGAVKSNKKKK